MTSFEDAKKAKNYRNAKFVERYEDVVYELDKSLVEPGNGARQTKEGHRFVVDSTGEITALDWYNARFNVVFKVTTLAGANLAVDDHNGIVNSSHSFIRKFNVKMGGVTVYDCSNVNHATNIKNLLEYSQGYVKSQGSNEFFYLDTTRHADEMEFTGVNVRNANGDGQTAVVESRNDEYNKGFDARKSLLGLSADVNTEIPLNRYGFFEALHGELLPNSRFEINVDIEKDNDLIWQAGADCRVVLTTFQLIIPRIVFNDDGKSLYAERFLQTRKWTYLRELVEPSESMTQRQGTWRISSGINKPRHVFVFIVNDVRVANATAQQNNKFLYDTFNPGGGNRKLNSCHLEVGNGKDYPEVHYKPNTEPTRVFRDLLRFAHANNYYAGDTLINRSNFESLYQLVYFDLTRQPEDVKDGSTKLSFTYELSDTAVANYTIYAFVLYEQDIEVRKKDGKLTLRSM